MSKELPTGYVRVRNIYSAKILGADLTQDSQDSKTLRNVIRQSVWETNRGSEIDWYLNGLNLNGIMSCDVASVVCYQPPKDMAMYGIKWVKNN